MLVLEVLFVPPNEATRLDPPFTVSPPLVPACAAASVAADGPLFVLESDPLPGIAATFKFVASATTDALTELDPPWIAPNSAAALVPFPLAVVLVFSFALAPGAPCFPLVELVFPAAEFVAASLALASVGKPGIFKFVSGFGLIIARPA